MAASFLCGIRRKTGKESPCKSFRRLSFDANRVLPWQNAGEQLPPGLRAQLVPHLAAEARSGTKPITAHKWGASVEQNGLRTQPSRHGTTFFAPLQRQPRMRLNP